MAEYQARNIKFALVEVAAGTRPTFGGKRGSFAQSSQPQQQIQVEEEDVGESEGPALEKMGAVPAETVQKAIAKAAGGKVTSGRVIKTTTPKKATPAKKSSPVRNTRSSGQNSQSVGQGKGNGRAPSDDADEGGDTDMDADFSPSSSSSSSSSDSVDNQGPSHSDSKNERRTHKKPFARRKIARSAEVGERRGCCQDC